MPIAKPRTPGLRPRPVARLIPPSTGRPEPVQVATLRDLPTAPAPARLPPLPPLFDSPARAVIDAFFGYVSTGVRREWAARGLALIYRGARAALVVADGVRETHDDGREDDLLPCVIAHTEDGVVYRAYTGYGATEPHVAQHIALFEAVFARWLRGGVSDE